MTRISPTCGTTRSTPISSAGRDGSATGPEGRSLVAIGGGSGLAVLLRGLKGHVGGERLGDLTGIVTVSDDGGSSGRLRRELSVLPPGDIRNCLVALADDEDLLARLFQYRFPNGKGLTGHSFGNLFLTALTGITGDFYQAVLTAESILSVRGRILPATLSHLRLRARGRSGRVYEGESAVGSSGERLDSLQLEPAAPPAFPPAVEALRQADLILLGPGSLYTSVLANLLIPGIRKAVEESPARVVLLLNLMTQPGETEGMSGLDHLEALRCHAGTDLVDTVLVNSTPLPPDRVERYSLQGSEPVLLSEQEAREAGVERVATDLLADGGLLSDGDLLRHDPDKLAAAVLDLHRPIPPDRRESRGERRGERSEELRA